jgi:hypothetical protein
VVSRNHERLCKSVVSPLSECGQFADWNREMMLNVTGMRAEFVQATGHELSMNVVQLLSSFAL